MIDEDYAVEKCISHSIIINHCMKENKNSYWETVYLENYHQQLEYIEFCLVYFCQQAARNNLLCHLLEYTSIAGLKYLWLPEISF